MNNSSVRIVLALILPLVLTWPAAAHEGPDPSITHNARGGTPLMQSIQTVGIDLPLKVLVWEDETGKTWISYNEPSWIAQRHGITNAEPIVPQMSDLLDAITATATRP